MDTGEVAVSRTESSGAKSWSDRLKVGPLGKNVLPEWCRLLLELGQSIASNADETIRTRQVVVCTVPARSYAALLIASGILLDRYESIQNTSPEEHFESLIALPPNTPLMLRPPGSSTTTSKVRLVGHLERGGVEYIKIEERKGRLRLLPKDQCLRLARVETTNTSRFGSRRDMRQDLGLLEAMLPTEVALSVVSSSSFECLILGHAEKNLIESEEGIFSAFVDGTVRTGALRDFVRPANESGAHSRTRIDSVSGANQTLTANSDKPAVIIADGATALFALDHRWRDHDQVIVLDRSSPPFDGALDQINANLIRGYDELTWLKELTVPAGIELTGYVQVVRR